ncbi:MAG TPA: hypothetical protein PK878_01985 [bacterium]|nr:hypothetical protein [Candidatus Omnitrophota bacterium]HOJ59033.1 hypothetical protein [bacterium]HOL93190.1 hypothetical protein [bacterium]HPP00195.1 hypothetical protein [bacterium]HXK93382.1 hypothetical protein [bacterium]
MWRKWLAWSSIGLALQGLFVAVGCDLASWPSYAQIPRTMSPAYDPATENSLKELRRLLQRGDREQVQNQLNRIIQGSGYIKPLAQIYYQMAQSETNASSLVALYSTIIAEWTSSAWAQKAVVELVPLILMSRGHLGGSVETLIWKHEAVLLSPAKDAAELGEDPQVLRADVFFNLLQLAHYRNDVLRVQSLAQKVPDKAKNAQDQIDLALAYAMLRSENKTQAQRDLIRWIERYPRSKFLPLAYYGLFLAADNTQQMESALQSLVKIFPENLVTSLLREALGHQ